MKVIEDIRNIVEKEMAKNESGHDMLHINRVVYNAKLIAKKEDVDMVVVLSGALLHDIRDAKFHDGDEKAGPVLAGQILQYVGMSKDKIEHVVGIVENISWRKGSTYDSKEFQVVQDADRLDAIGAIGVARAFSYGGYKERPMYDVEYKDPLTTVAHFYDKLFLVKDKLHTQTAREIAEAREQFMYDYIDQLKAEIEGKR